LISRGGVAAFRIAATSNAVDRVRLPMISALRASVHRPAAIGAPARLITASADSTAVVQPPGSRSIDHSTSSA
jgi:hypothetical protein